MAYNRICEDCGSELLRWKKQCEPCRFWSWVKKSSGCWTWVGTTNQDGYGRIRIFGKTRSAHRVAWMLVNKLPKEPSAQVLHKCDRPSCVAPRHLFLGTISDNMKDAYRKGRKSNNGERNPNSSLLPFQVRNIRAMAKSGVTRYRLSKIFKINWTTADRIVRRITWASL